MEKKVLDRFGRRIDWEYTQCSFLSNEGLTELQFDVQMEEARDGAQWVGAVSTMNLLDGPKFRISGIDFDLRIPSDLDTFAYLVVVLEDNDKDKVGIKLVLDNALRRKAPSKEHLELNKKVYNALRHYGWSFSDD